MTTQFSHAMIVQRLRAEALHGVYTGWISDLVHFDPEFSEEEQSIEISAPEYGAVGSIDLGQLARVVEAIIEEAAP